MKQFLPLLICGILWQNMVWSQNRLYMNPIKFTDRSIQTYGHTCDNTVKFYLNGQPFTNYQIDFVCCGLYFIKFDYGLLKPGDIMEVQDGCGSIKYSQTVQDDFVYVEIPAGSSHLGNGIDPNDASSPYGRLTTPTQVGQCENLTINAHVLLNYRIFSQGTNGNTTGAFLINNVPFVLGDHTVDNNGQLGVVTTVNANGSFSTTGNVRFDSKAYYSGNVPLTLEYRHNGWNIAGDFQMSIGGMRMIFNNNGVEVKKRTYTGAEITAFYTVSTANPVYKLTYDSGYYRAYINGVKVDEMQRTVVYTASAGTLSNTGGLTYLTGVTYTPNQAGSQWVAALIDGVRYVRQLVQVADNLTANATVVNVACSGGNTGSITASQTGGKGGYQYSLNGGAFGSSATFSNLTSGNYTITVRDTSGCTASKSVTIGQNSALTLSTLSKTNVVCAGEQNGSVNLSASGGATPYTYSKDGINFSSTSNFGSLTEGNYTFTVKDAAGCSQTLAENIGFQSKIVASSTATTLSCFGGNNGSINIVTTGSSPSGTLQYSLNGGTFGTSANFSNLVAGTYTISVKDNLCQKDLSTVITQPADITATLSVNSQVSCFGGNNGSVLTTASGGTGTLTYSIDNTTFGNNSIFGSLVANSYKVWVKDDNGCIKQSNVVTITQPTDITFSIKNKTDIKCFGVSTGSVSLAANGGIKNYSFKIGNGTFQSDSTFGSLAAGSYTFTLQDANGCQKTTATTLIQPTDMVATGIVTQTVNCNGGTNGAILASGSGGVSPYTYALSDNNYVATTAFSGLMAGTYKVWVKDANGCKKASADIIVTQPNALSLVAAVTAVKCKSGNDGAVTLTAGGGAGNYTYALAAGSFQTSNTFGGLTANTYNFTVKDANNCTKTIDTTVKEPTALVATLAITQQVSCFGGSNGSILTTANGGTPLYQYSLNDVTYQTSATFTNLPINTYRVWVKDANGCKLQTNAVTITQPTDIVLSTSVVSPVKCFNGSDGSVALQASGGVGSFQFANGNGAFQVSSTFANLTSNTYTFKVKDGNGCLKNLSVQVTQPAQAFGIALASTQNLSCFQNVSGRITVNGSGGTSPYQFSLDNSTFQTSTIFSNLSALTYTVYGKDANNCTFSLSNITLTQPTDIAITLLRKKDVDCEYYQRGEALVSASGSNGNFTYSLTGIDFKGNPTAPATNTTGLFTNLLAGNYTLKASDQVGCPKDFPITIIPKSSGIRYDLAKTLPTSCTASDGRIQVQNISGGRAPYQFNISGQATFTTNPTFSNLINGVYMITVADSLCAYKQTADLRLPNSLTGNYQLSPVSCAVPTANLQVTTVTGGNGNYSWSLNGGNFTSNPNYTNLAPNVYQLVFRDNPLSCQTALGFEIKEQNRADLQLTSKTDISCFNGSDGIIKVAGTNNLSPFQYAINNGPYTPNNTFQNLAIGNYLMLAKNSFGCIDSIRVVLTQPTLLTLTNTKKDNDCFADNTGRLEGAANGGTTPYQYTIDGSSYQNLGIFDKLVSGVYTLQVKDAKGCITTNQVAVNQPTIVTVNPVYQDTVRCFGESNGVVRVIAGGGTPGYQYSKDGQNYFPSDIFDNLPAGSYTFYVKDLKQCVKQNSFVVTQPTVAKISFVSKRDPLCYGDQNGIIEVLGTGGNGNYTFQVNNTTTQTSPIFTGLTQAHYDFKLTDRRGCTDTLNQIKLVWPKPLLWTSTTTMPLCFGDANGSISVNIDGGTLPYQASIPLNTANVVANSHIFKDLSSTTYQVQITDKNGCVNTQAIFLPQPTQLAATIIPKNNDCFDDTTGRIEIIGKEATPPYQYAIEGGELKAIGLFTGLKANTYVVSVKDKNGCTIKPKVPIIQPTLVVVRPIYQDTVRCFGESNGVVKVMAEGGTPGYQYSKDGQSYFTDSLFKSLPAGNYTFYVRDSKRCVQQNTLQVTQPTTLVMRLVSQKDPLCIGEQNGIIQTAATGGNGSYVFVMDNVVRQLEGRFGGLTQGQYAFKLIDRKQCEATIAPVTLRWPAALETSLTPLQPKCVGDYNGGFTIQVKGGVGPYKLRYNNQDAIIEERFSAENLPAGSYPIAINDANGCAVVQHVKLMTPDSINKFNLGDSAIVTCKGQLVTLNTNNPDRINKWVFNNKEISSNPSITVSEPGIYTVEVRNNTGCVIVDAVEIKNSNRALDADFLMPTQGLLGDTIVALDITKPIPDKILWKLPSSSYKIVQTSSTISFVMTAEGVHPVEMKAIKGECENIVKHDIKIFPREQVAETDSTLGFQQYNIIESATISPNPNDGRFFVNVKLLKVSDVTFDIVRHTTSQSVFRKWETGKQEYELFIDLVIPSDTYILTIRAGQSILSRRLIIIN